MTNRDKVNEMARFCAVHDCRSCKIREECHNAGIRWKPELTWSGLLKEYPNSFGLVYSALCKITEEKLVDGKTEEKADDMVQHPAHYTAGGIECIDAMVSAFGAREVSNYCICNAFKYIFRHERKNGEEDIAKAEWYLAKYRELRYGTLENH